MLKFLGRKREQPPQPAWLKWLIIIFLVFIVVGGLHKGSPNKPDQLHMAFQKAESDLAPNRIINFNEYKNIFLASYGSEMRLRDTAPGHGEPAICGQQVRIAYATFSTDNTPLPDKADKNKPLAFTIGDGKAMPVFEQGVPGMKAGGTRSILVPTNMAYGAPGFARPDMPSNASVRFDIELLSTQPELPELAASPYRVAPVRGGLGEPIQCGKPAKVSLTLWSIEGKKLYQTPQPVTFTPGKSEVFLGLEQGCLGLAKGGVRTLIVPPPFQKTLNGNAPAVDFPFPKGQTVLVDVEAVP